MSLEELRRAIDQLDNELLDLLAKRAEVVTRVGEEKRKLGVAVHDPGRERAILERLASQGAGRFPREAILAVFREVMSASVSMQQPISIGFLGPPGTYSQMAARAIFGLSARYTEAATIEGVFDAVRKGTVTCGVVPIENSTEGPVTGTIDALLEGGAQIRGEHILDVAHGLLSRATGLSSIERVYSHPQALAQCRKWLAQNLPQVQLVQTSSTAGAVREAQLDPQGAAIGSALAAELHGLPLLRERVQDQPENATRFVVIGAQDAPPSGNDKTTVAFTIASEKERGALRRTLEIIDDAGVNMTHIESRPSKRQRWEYTFVVDLEGHRSSEALQRALEGLRQRTDELLILGSYPRVR